MKKLGVFLFLMFLLALFFNIVNPVAIQELKCSTYADLKNTEYKFLNFHDLELNSCLIYDKELQAWILLE